jgi:hypothetical protein
MGMWYVFVYIDTLIKYATEGIHAKVFARFMYPLCVVCRK